MLAPQRIIRRKRKSITLRTLSTESNCNGSNKENQDSNQEHPEQRPTKRVKYQHTEPKNKSKTIGGKCTICLQKLTEDIKIYQGPPNDASEEYIALTDEKLSLFETESNIDVVDEFPNHKLTYFSVFDQAGHLCPFDTGLIDSNVHLYFSGYIKPIYDEDPSPKGGIPAKMMGPIVEWSISGFDGGEFVLVYIRSQFAEYVLMEPSEEYAPFMMLLKEKSYMSKYLIEFLLDEINPSYEDLINKLETIVQPNDLKRFTEETLIRHAQFLCDQVLSIDAAAEGEDTPLIRKSCMRSLVNLAGVTLGRTNALRQMRAKRQDCKPKTLAWTKATTTQLVNNMFENFFSDQLIGHDDKMNKHRKIRCGVCGHCQEPDCGQCVACKDMIKFGGTGKSKQACIRRRCPNMIIRDADDSEPEDDEPLETATKDINTFLSEQASDKKTYKEVFKKIAWQGVKIASDTKGTFYSAVTVGGETIKVHDYVLVEPDKSFVPSYIAKVVYMWETKKGKKMFHANWFYRGNETILGETSHPGEIFLCEQCVDLPFNAVRSKCTVIHKKAPENWAELGNTNLGLEDEATYEDGKTFFYQKRYSDETARFEDPFPEVDCTSEEKRHSFCAVCDRLEKLTRFNTPEVYKRIAEKSSREVTYGLVKYKGENYVIGSGVFLMPEAFNFEYRACYDTALTEETDDIDEELYTEYYRKIKQTKIPKGSNINTPEPFCIGCISEIYATTRETQPSPDNIYIKVNKLYRPENTHSGHALMEEADLNMVYWSNEVQEIKFIDIVGKCYLAYIDNILIHIDDWTSAGPYRFYFTEAYNIEYKTFEEAPYHARCLGKSDIYRTSKGIAKLKGKKSEKKDRIDKPIEHKVIGRKLRTLDVFAGCGGLSEGLHQSGISETCWAIEKIEEAANAFRKNNPQATVFLEDCNMLLKRVMDGETRDRIGQKLPQKGEVEMLCGGPPCQGFSGMNRFNTRQYSLFKNSLVVSFLSYCDYYRPKFFIMENVRNFVTFKKSMVLKLTLSCLIRMGYQCAVDYLQAGNYGVPQTRQRMILLAAAPGQKLPRHPEATHVFSSHICGSRITIAGKYYKPRDWDSAPYRTITVQDALSDLPEIVNGWMTGTMAYTIEPLSHFQRKMRQKCASILSDHICKNMSPLVLARISYIPCNIPGSDWRDLPNKIMYLSNNVITSKLEYTHDDIKMGRGPKGELRGVCSCAEGKACNPADRQYNTLIPWCLPHTGARHNQWAGLYGRLQWDGYFSTTITNPEPMGKQGRVLHPDQNRVVSVRECARSQGFPDYYRFYGTVYDMHRQVGNAVPPPLAAAIGLEIRKCVHDADVKSEHGNLLTEDTKSTGNTEELMIRRKTFEEEFQKIKLVKDLEKPGTSQHTAVKVKSERIEDYEKPSTSRQSAVEVGSEPIENYEKPGTSRQIAVKMKSELFEDYEKPGTSRQSAVEFGSEPIEDYERPGTNRQSAVGVENDLLQELIVESLLPYK